MHLRTAALFALLAFAAPAQADPLSDSVGTFPAGIEDVRVAGSWTDDSGAGVYRLVIARDAGVDAPARFFVQWIAYGGDGAASIVHSIEIPELAELNLNILGYHAESEGEGLSVFLDTVDATGDVSQTYELFVTSPESYRFGSATN